MMRWLVGTLVFAVWLGGIAAPSTAHASEDAFNPIGDDPEVRLMVLSVITLATNVPVGIDLALGDGAAPWWTVPAMITGSTAVALGGLFALVNDDDEQRIGLATVGVGMGTIIHSVVASILWRTGSDQPDDPEDPDFQVAFAATGEYQQLTLSGSF